MIWYFLMGMIGGAVGVILVENWWLRTHMKRLNMDEFMEEIKKMEEDEAHE